ncbi:NADPH-dependent FMN reductase, partial [Mesorhizobium sp. M7A.F.Ca.AU.002.02.1.1]
VGVMPIPEGVALPMYQKLLDENGAFNASEQVQGGAKTMLDGLLRWSEALKPMRAG